jgi:peroxiredoxin Q/BCP
MPERSAQEWLAPAFAMVRRDQDGGERRLSDFRGHNLVVYFYPKDDTPGCTVEGKEFRDLHQQFQAFDAVIVGVSTDGVASHRAFADKHALPFTLLADEGGELAGVFGVLRDGFAARSTFVFDHDLRLQRVFRDVGARGHARQVLDFIRSLVEARRMLGG